MMSSVLVQWLCSFAAIVGFICPLDYSALPFQVKVVDAETGLPLEGVIVDAQWRMESRGGHSLGWFTATEAVTDKEGIARMPGWGPLRIPNMRGGYLAQGRLTPNEPSLMLYLDGYHLQGVGPDDWQSTYLDHPYWTGDLVRKAELDNTIVRLMPFRGTSQKYVEQLFSGQSETATARCLWIHTPRMTAALINEGKRFKNSEPTYLITLKDVLEYDDAKYCGSKDLVRQYLK
jgi:hypothetical protein